MKKFCYDKKNTFFDVENGEDAIMKKKTVVLLLCSMSVVLASCGKTTDAKNEVQETTEVAVN